MSEFSLKELIKYYKSKIFIMIIIFVFVFIVGVFYLEKLSGNTYATYTSFVLLDKEGLDIEKTSSETYTSTVTEIMKSDKVLNQVINILNLDVKPKDINEDMEYLVVGEAIKIEMTSNTKTNLVETANEIINVLSKELKNYYPDKKVVVLDEAKEAILVEEMNYLKSIKKYILIATFTSVAVVFVLYYFPKLFSKIKEI